MLAWLPPLFFFAVLMGSPVPGFLVFMFIGMVHAWQSWRQPQSANAFHWKREDTWLALCFMSIPLFKLLSAAWSASPAMAVQNAVWHGYFLFWPVVMLGLQRCHAPDTPTEKSIALGLLAFAAYAIALHLSGGAILDYGRQNVGVLAQLTLAMGSWNLLILSRPSSMSPLWRRIHALAVLGTVVVLISSTRRLELLGFVLMAMAIGAWRMRHRLSATRIAMLITMGLVLLGLLVYVRREKFLLGMQELSNFWALYQTQVDVKLTSWGARIEMWRTAAMAFAEHPFLGLGADARPSTMQPWGAPPADVFGHRHFHSHLVQTLIEGGLAGLLVLGITLWVSLQSLVFRPWESHPEVALLALALFVAYAIEGTFSAALFYDKPNAFLVIASAWLWLRCRRPSPNADSSRLAHA